MRKRGLARTWKKTFEEGLWYRNFPSIAQLTDCSFPHWEGYPLENLYKVFSQDMGKKMKGRGLEVGQDHGAGKGDRMWRGESEREEEEVWEEERGTKEEE